MVEHKANKDLAADIPGGAKVLLYGTGSSAVYFIQQHQQALNLVGVTDGQVNAPLFQHFPCFPLQDISQIDCDFIVVASWAITDISQRLMNSGVAKEKILWFQHNKNRVVACDHPDALVSHQELSNDNILYAFYDLDVARTTYDVLGFLCLADMAREKAECDAVHVVVVNASNNDFNVAARGIISTKEHVWRKRQILAQSCGLLPTCSGFSFTSTRQEAISLFEQAKHIFPEDYQVTKPTACWEFDNLFKVTQLVNDVSRLQASEQARNLVQQFLDNVNPIAANGERKKVICITLRESDIKPARNSNLVEWQAFIQQLDKNTYFPLILPDTDNSWSESLMAFIADTGAAVFTEACFNVELRMAIYELSYVNLGVNNGPMHLCALSPTCRYIMYKQVTEDYAHTSTQSFIDRGFTIGGDFAGANQWQKLVWADDDAPVIQESFERLVAEIEASSASDK
ncbi:hypothetical protein KIH87_03890 [Paraneptunicella aestuarii]|uniref:hypothetical protein n=1 Tax=Paraneptunicella aestuarii TaxID=2831148 RepID=UPI001E30CAA4|nr:hypothetical protein [Paraneptunicella aestuarii]UAA39507.1 hypothetical protein KIH87_03890 [Paraneptunicella aestuarii]